MNFTQEHLARRERVMKWYAPARLGLFYHWGLYTGGGCTHATPEYSAPLTYREPAALEDIDWTDVVEYGAKVFKVEF